MCLARAITFTEGAHFLIWLCAGHPHAAFLSYGHGHTRDQIIDQKVESCALRSRFFQRAFPLSNGFLLHTLLYSRDRSAWRHGACVESGSHGEWLPSVCLPATTSPSTRQIPFFYELQNTQVTIQSLFIFWWTSRSTLGSLIYFLWWVKFLSIF